MPSEPIFHLADPAEWAAAQASGDYERSTREQSLAEVGFIHTSFRHQLDQVANSHYAGVDELVLLTIDPERLDAELKVESIPPGGEEFPHIYGPLPIAAVIAADPVHPAPSGRWELS